MRLFLFLSLALSFTPVWADEQPKILMMGDSLLSTHHNTQRSVGFVLEELLETGVRDVSTPGAKIIHLEPISGLIGMSIPRQFRKGAWDWVVLNGGGNDLWLGCGCLRCDRRMDRMISEDGTTGAIPKLVNRLTETGAHVLYVGYLRSPGLNSMIEHCLDEGEMLEERLGVMADAMEGVTFLTMRDVVPFGDASFLGFDRVHPSPKASREIAQRLATYIESRS